MQHEPQFVMKASDELDRQTLSVPQRRRAGGHAATVAVALSKAARAARWSGVRAASAASNGSVGTEMARMFS